MLRSVHSGHCTGLGTMPCWRLLPPLAPSLRPEMTAPEGVKDLTS